MDQDTRVARLQSAMSALARISADADSIEGLLRRIVDEAMQITGADGAVVERIEGEQLCYLTVAGTIADFAGLRIPRSGSLSGLCVDTSQVQACADSDLDPRVHREACRKIGARSMLIVPLLFAGETIGVLKATSTRAQAFDDFDQQLLELAAQVVAGALGREHRLQSGLQQQQRINAQLLASQSAEQHWRDQSLSDALTGLANRRQFDLWLDQVIAQPESLRGHAALCFIDVNRFKAINDSYGHEVGDAALRHIAARLRSCARESDRVARLAGDEFVALLQPSAADGSQAEWFARKLLLLLANEPLLAAGHSIPLGISIGIALDEPTGIERGEWLHRADQAMYIAKAAGTGHYHRYQPPGAAERA